MRHLFVIAAMVAIVSVFAACNQNENESDDTEDHVVSVETSEATIGDLVVEKTLYGQVQPAATTPVMVPNSGEITELNVANGDTVEENASLLTIKTAAGSRNIRASTAGNIAQLDAEEGDRVSGSDPVMVISNVDPMIITASVTTDIRQLLEKGTTYTVTIGEQDYDAELTERSAMPGDKGLYPIKATINPNPDDAETVLTGMTATMHIPEKRVSDAIIVPTESVVTGRGDPFVYVVENSKAVKTDVVIRETKSKKTAVKGVIQDGDHVVVNGLLTLSDGASVNVVKERDDS
ncbi:hypothetical protein GCM10008983_11550 [Lentibacillus halophilus]|uniref:RND family efflux transporter, MFP subunit n=2 Tax=Lentibacillus halophilus TaxID=295065 RepID=A0ABN0Z6U4_9BACI